MSATMPLELQAARLRLVRDRPYLAAAAWALQPVERPGLGRMARRAAAPGEQPAFGTLAVDRWWRLYYDPSVVHRWTTEQLAAVLYHEILHLLRAHPDRMRAFERRVANLAADAEINDDIIAEHLPLPGQPVTPAGLGMPSGLLAEEYAAALQAKHDAMRQTQQSAPGQGASANPSGDGSAEAGESRQGDEARAGQGGSPADGAEQSASATDAAGSNAAEAADSSSTRGRGSGPADSDHPEGGGDAGASHAGGDADSMSTSPSQNAPAASQPPAGPVSAAGHARGDTGTPEGDQTQTPEPGAGRCGSCATGQQEPWEDGPPGAVPSPGTGQAEAELIRRQVARQIVEHNRTCGNVPGHLQRWAEKKLRPRVDWRRELAAAIRAAIADVAGMADYSYRRPSRRQGQVGNGKVVLPSLRRPVPEVAVIVDTSGSMSNGLLAKALAEVAGVLRATGQGAAVLAVDTTVQAVRRVFDPRQVVLTGGGGTDMGAGLAAASKLKPRPQVAIVLTDGYTPWPKTPPRKMRVVVGLLDPSGATAEWARTVKIEEK